MEKYCNNCGNKGHLYRNCRHPILSYGIFIYTKDKNGEYETILVERKDSLAYIEFLRGKYKYLRNKTYIQLLFNRLSNEEKEKLVTHEFRDLWNMLWIHVETINRKIQNEYKHSMELFNSLKNGYMDNGELINFQYFIDHSDTNYTSNEWEIPKGRRNNGENNRDCAIREFQEETNLAPSSYRLFNNIIPLIEEYTGINNVRYKHVYYVGELIKPCKLFIDKSKKEQYTEIKNIQWANENKALLLIRDYNQDKQGVMKRFFDFIKSYEKDVSIKK